MSARKSVNKEADVVTEKQLNIPDFKFGPQEQPEVNVQVVFERGDRIDSEEKGTLFILYSFGFIITLLNFFILAKQVWQGGELHMKNIRTVSRQEYDAEVEDKIQKLTKYAYITQGDLAEIIGCCSATVKTELNKLGVESNCFGWPTTKVINVLGLQPYLDNLIKLRKSCRA